MDLPTPELIVHGTARTRPPCPFPLPLPLSPTQLNSKDSKLKCLIETRHNNTNDNTNIAVTLA